VTLLAPEPLAVRVSGEASKRGLIPRLPNAERLLGDVEAWLVAEYPDVVRSPRRAALATGQWALELGLHPAAPRLSIVATEETVRNKRRDGSSHICKNNSSSKRAPMTRARSSLTELIRVVTAKMASLPG
jgi:hypothetical protein